MPDDKKAPAFVTLYNAESGQEWECPAKAVDFWVAHGYRKNDPFPSRSGSSGAITPRES